MFNFILAGRITTRGAYHGTDDDHIHICRQVSVIMHNLLRPGIKLKKGDIPHPRPAPPRPPPPPRPSSSFSLDLIFYMFSPSAPSVTNRIHGESYWRNLEEYIPWIFRYCLPLLFLIIIIFLSSFFKERTRVRKNCFKRLFWYVFFICIRMQRQ